MNILQKDSEISNAVSTFDLISGMSVGFLSGYAYFDSYPIMLGVPMGLALVQVLLRLSAKKFLIQIEPFDSQRFIHSLGVGMIASLPFMASQEYRMSLLVLLFGVGGALYNLKK